MKLSIIVPAFNVQKYIAACLDSLLDQNMDPSDYEIIVINDGSPDNSGQIARAYAQKHSNIIVRDQDNGGVSVARSHGLDLAKGEYIAFVDPDDTLHPNSMLPILKRADDEMLEILYLQLEIFDEKTGKFLATAEPNGTDHKVLDGFKHPRRTYLSTLYRRDVIGKIRFTTGITRGQDTVFNLMVQARAKRCSYCSFPYYKYLQRDSSSRQFVGTERNFKSCLLAIETINNYQKKCFPEPDPEQRTYFNAGMLIFIQRTLEWNIFPQSNKANFDRLKQRLNELELGYLIDSTAKTYKYFDSNFAIFMTYRKAKRIYARLRKLFA